MGNEESVPAMAEDVEVEEEVQKLRNELKKEMTKNWRRARSRGRILRI